MMFLDRVCTICLFILLTTYNADSYKWQTKELEDNTSFPLNYTSLKRLVEPLSYKIYLDTILEKDNAIFRSDTEIFFIIEYPTMQINLNAHGLTIRKEDIFLYRYLYGDRYKLTNLSYLNETETLIIDFATEIPSGYYNMLIVFTGNISENEVGFYRTTCENCPGALKSIFVTQLKPTAARRVFPCWDDPVFRTNFDIVIKHHRNYTSFSNMPMRQQHNISDITWTKFHATPPIPTYLVAFAVMDFHCSIKKDLNSITRVCSTSLVKKQITFVQSISNNVVEYMQVYTQMSPRLREITQIGLQNFSYEATGNWGFNIYRENHLIYNKILHPIEHKLDVWMYVSSMVALQWVGNLVSPTSWTHMWFSQTLALFYGVKAFNEIYDDKDITSLFTYRLQSLARKNNAVSQVKPFMHPASNRDEVDRLIKSNHFTNCLKEYAIIAMLEYTVTESIFQRATITYLKKYQFSTATPNDFWDILQDTIEEKGDGTHPPIAQVVQSWLKQRSLPVITVMRDQIDSFDNYTVIVIKPSHSSTEDDDNAYNLFIPINYITTSNVQKVSGIEWLNSPNQQFNLRPIFFADWVIFNWQNIGYYRVQYDTTSLNILATYMSSNQRTNINVLNRAHMIEEAYYFWKEKKLNINIFINLIYFMWYEKQCAPWYAMQNIIQKMWSFLNIDVGRYAKHAIVNAFDLLLRKIGYTKHSNDTDCIKFTRLLAMKWVCRLLHPPCLEIAHKRLFEHLEDPEINIISPMWEEWTYCNGLVLSEKRTWSRVFREYQRTRNKRILKYLACPKNISIILNYLDVIMSNNSIISYAMQLNSEDRQHIYRWIIKRHISSNEMLNLVLEKIKQMEINDELIEKISYIIENVYSRSQMGKIKLFLRKDIDLNRALYNKLISKMENQQSRVKKLEQLAH